MQVKEGLGIVKQLHKIVAAAAGKDGDGRVVIACRTGSHLVQRPVAAAGVDADLFALCGCFPGDADGLSRGCGDPDLVIQLPGTADLVDGVTVFLGPVVASRRGIDNE